MVMAGHDNSGETLSSGGVNIKSLAVDSLTVADIPDERLDDMVLRILTVYYGFRQDSDFPDHTFNAWIDRPKNVYKYSYEFQESRKLTRDIGAASVILLKNDARLLPLDPKIKIGVVGEDARRPTILNDEGTWDGTLAQGLGSGSCEFPYIIAPIDGIRKRVEVSRGGFVLEYTKNNDLNSGKTVAEKVDVVIVFANAQSGEGWDRGDLKLNKGGNELVSFLAQFDILPFKKNPHLKFKIEAVASINKNTIVVIHTVGQIEMPWINHPNISAVLFPLMPGQETGNSLADVLFGDVNPSGRLPFTIYRNQQDYAAQVVTSSPDKIPQVNYNEGLYFDYRHVDKYNIKPLFPFGHGLSYTSFEYANLKITTELAGSVKVSVDIKNIGNYNGHEVVQLYVQFPETAEEPPKLLKGFDRVFIVKGSTVKVLLHVEKRDLRVWLHGGWKWVAGTYGFVVGASSKDLRLEESIVLF
ncbi:hypothetical protein HK100_004822 [Physocladia obscura]|uniref:beta-glucosidase n=1 Tax=Physocladia obscura TaxID=109957 RepID=A0AAD5XDM6_9FUNG|nr:hypothetical protein HK100_004822 [Physocladia obscura]